MDSEKLENLTNVLGGLTANEQDYLAGFLLMERLKRNQLVMPALHQRVEDADPDNWQNLESVKKSLSDD